jgi:hypothetical protein
VPSVSTRILGLAALGAVLAIASPVRAETPAECQGMFQASDISGDGVLSGVEIAVSDHIDGDLAAAFGDQGSVTLSIHGSLHRPVAPICPCCAQPRRD